MPNNRSRGASCASWLSFKRPANFTHQPFPRCELTQPKHNHFPMPQPPTCDERVTVSIGHPIFIGVVRQSSVAYLTFYGNECGAGRYPQRRPQCSNEAVSGAKNQKQEQAGSGAEASAGSQDLLIRLLLGASV